MSERKERTARSAFDIGHWHSIILFALVDFRDLTALAQDEEAVAAHANRREIRHFTESGEEVPSDDPRLSEWLRKSVLQGVTRSRRTHIQLLVVYIVAVVEKMLDEFLLVCFIMHPDWMYDYLRLTIESEIKGIVTLKDVVSASSKTELIEKLAKRATDNANRGTLVIDLRESRSCLAFHFPRIELRA